MLAVRRNRAFAISTESLLHLSHRCNISQSANFGKLNEINSENTRKLRHCLEAAEKADNVRCHNFFIAEINPAAYAIFEIYFLVKMILESRM